MNNSFIFLYGPSGGGKSTAGKLLAHSLDIPFTDLDALIEQDSGQTIAEIFHLRGEDVFRRLELTHLEQLVEGDAQVVALGGGALINPQCRALTEKCGRVILLKASAETLYTRLLADAQVRPLLAGDPEKLKEMLARRKEHYASFPEQIDTGGLTPVETAWQIQIALGRFRIHTPGSAGRAGQEAYDVLVQTGGLDQIGDMLKQRGLHGPVMIVSDEQVGALYAERVAVSLSSAGYTHYTTLIPAGEEHKRMGTIITLWDAFLTAGLERRSTVLGLGGGVVTDMAGYAASAYLRGIRWAALSTSLLGMVDASLGGKTGIDLPRGKNLVGAFHSPALVVADPAVLQTLPREELRSGMAEALKHGVISDPELFSACLHLQDDSVPAALVQRAIAIKARVVELDPFEHHQRAALNLGHTIGHAIEQASNFTLRHGEAVAIGMVVETRLAEDIGLAENGLTGYLAAALIKLGLPTTIPSHLDPAKIFQSLVLDKKKSSGKVRFALPVKIGEVKTGIEIDEERIRHAISAGVTWA